MGNAPASAVSVALPLFGIAPGASQERQEVDWEETRLTDG